MGKLRFVFVMAMFIAIVACSTTSQELRSAPRIAGSFHLDLPFGTVRSNVIDETYKCYPGRGTNASYFYRRFQDDAPGESVTIDVIQGGLVTRAWISIDVKRSPLGGTDVSYFVGPRALFVDFPDVIQNWAAGTGKCRI